MTRIQRIIPMPIGLLAPGRVGGLLGREWRELFANPTMRRSTSIAPARLIFFLASRRDPRAAFRKIQHQNPLEIAFTPHGWIRFQIRAIRGLKPWDVQGANVQGAGGHGEAAHAMTTRNVKQFTPLAAPAP